MVKRLTEDEMNEWMKNKTDIKWIGMQLSNNKIQEWIQMGLFTHLRKELSVYQNVSFGCLKRDIGCQYFFISDNKTAINRIDNLLVELFENKKTPLIKCNTTRNDKYMSLFADVRGRYNACPLF